MPNQDTGKRNSSGPAQGGRFRPNLAMNPPQYSFSRTRSSSTPLLLEEELGDLDGVERGALEQLVARDEHVDAVAARLGQLGPAVGAVGGDVVAHAAHQDLVEARDLVEGWGWG